MYQPLNLTGSRYVYFKSLPPDNPMYSKVSSLYAIGNLLTQTTNTNTSSNQHLNNITKYINFIGEMATTARSNELAFLEQQLTALGKLNDSNNELSTWLNNFKQGIIDYDKLFLLFNGLLQDSHTDQTILDRIKSNGHAILRMFEKFPQSVRDELQTLYNSNMQLYKARLDEEKTKLFGEKGRIEGFQQSYSRLFANKINSILRIITSKSEFKQTIINAYNNSSNLDISEDEFKRIIVNYVIDQTLTNGSIKDNRDTRVLAKNIINDIQNNFSEIQKNMFNESYIYAFDTIGTSIEEIALTGENGLGEFVSTLNDASIKKIKDKYLKRGDTSLSNDIDRLVELSQNISQDGKKELTAVKTRVTRQLKQRIREKTEIPNIIHPSALHTQFEHLITPTRTRVDILEKIKGVSISHDALAEAIGSYDMKHKLVKALTSKITGPTIKYKADIRCSTGYIDDGSLELFEPKEIENIIDSVITQYADSFFLKYQQKASGQTDVALAMESYSQWVSEMERRIKEIVNNCDQIIDKDKAVTEIYKQFEKTFSISVSVKDYDLMHNDLGMHGGSLGSQTNPEQVMKNIYKMYELGGITDLDVDKLMTAVINCGDAMLGSSLREPLQTYLLGGAALIMFDDSFALSENFLQSMTSQLKGQKVVNIYRLSTRYVPGSFILDEIHKNLIKIYSSLETEYTQLDQHNKVTITNNVTDAIIQNYQHQSREDQWELVRSYTESHIHITFSFMAGLLDILDRLPQAFNI